jgi:acyl-coenzyme A synthetase/AMP-(fatty) acid ligase
MLAALPEVAAAVVVHDHAIEAYLVLAEGADTPAVEHAITTRLAAYKRPRRLHVVEQLPRTATGKLVRSQAVLRDIEPGRPALRDTGPGEPVMAPAPADAGHQAAESGHPLPEGTANHDR